MTGLTQKKEIILRHELEFADSIGSAILEKPKVSIWLIFIPILFLFFIYRMKKFKNDRGKFVEEFMTARRTAMGIALDAAAAEGRANPDIAAQIPDLPEPLKKPYISWMKILSAHYLELLTADGDDFRLLVRTAYRNRDNYLLALDRLNTAEKEFHTALKPYLDSVEGSSDITASIESLSRRLRSEMAGTIFR
ncbi:MAG: NF038143 family protein [Proteobacteria bacterium]|nr:NF038143 family protein [Pseudomonadota bacterium]MBU1398782.1 NF038143 family protein [Pseudomonadota bacterium]MBU1570865.1 NF038143 family protein [Pseudomonadota bacterium]